MNKKIFFAAVAAAALTACTSEEALESVAVKPAESGMPEVVGAKLAGKGIVANVTNGEDETRLGKSGWSSDDKIGLAWIENGQGDITAPQGTALEAASSLTDPKLYANTILTTSDNGKTFNSMANVYEGAYFMYSPWAYMSTADALSFTPNATKQAKDVDTERYEKLPWVSGMQFIAADDDIKEGKVTVDFKLNPVANTLRFVTTPEANIKNALGEYVISKVTVKECANAVWYETMTIDPSILADETTYETLDAAIKAMVTGTPANNISTEVDPAYEKASLAGEGEFRIFALPTESGAVSATTDLVTEWLVFEFEVSDKDGNKIGYFNIDPLQMDPANAATYSKKNTAAAQKLLEALMDPSALFAKSITGILRGANGNPAALKLEMDLRVKDLIVTLFDEISDIDEWNLAVELFDALHEGETDAEANFTVDGPIAFVDEIKVPETAKQLNVKTTGAPAVSTFAGKGEMPAKIKGASYAPDNLHIVVLNESELTVNSSSEVPTVGNVTFGTTAATTDDPATELDETVPGRIIIENVAAMVNTEAVNGGEIIVKQSAVVADGNTVKRPAIYNAAAGAIIYELTSNLEDKAGTTAGAFTEAMFNATSPLDNATVLRLNGAALTVNASSVTSFPVEVVAGTCGIVAPVNYTTAAISVAKDATLNLEIGTTATPATLTVGNITGKGVVVVKGNGTITGGPVASDIEITVKPGVNNAL